MAATKFITGSRNVDKIGGTLLKVAGAMAIMMIVAKMAAKMSPSEMLKGGIAITFFGLVITGLMYVTKFITGSKNVDKIGGTLFKVAGAIAIMMIVAKMAAKMEPGEMLKGALAIIFFGGIIVGLMAACKLLTKSNNVDKIGGTLLKAAGAIAIMMIVAKIAASMTIGELIQGGLAVAAFGGIIVGLMAACKLLTRSTNIEKIGGTLIAVAGAIVIMMIAAKIAASMSVGEIIQGGLAVAAFAAIIVGLMYFTKLISNGENVTKIGTTILMMAGAIAIMALAAALLALVKPERLLVATAALAVLMGMFALIMYCAKDVTASLPVLIVLTAAIGVMAGALAIVAQFPAEQALASAGSLALVMLAMSAVLLIISKINVTIKDLIPGIIGLAAIIALLYGVVGALALMEGMENAVSSATALGSLMDVLAAVLLVVGIVGAIYAATGGVAMLGLVGLAAIIALLFPLIGAIALIGCIEDAQTNINALISMMSALTKILVVLAIVGPFALIGVAAMGGLTMLMLALGTFAVAIGALAQKFPALQTFLDTGLDLLIQLAGGIGKMIGAFITGIAEQLLTILPSIGTALSDFMENVQYFVTNVKMVDEQVLKGVGILATVVLALTAANLISSIGAFLGGGLSFVKLGLGRELYYTSGLVK